MHAAQHTKIATGAGFIAALDQSGGSTPKALAAYGVPDTAFSNEEEMFDLVHQMRARIVTSPSFSGERILGAILFEGTMDREIEGVPSAAYLWNSKQVVPFVKVDEGLDEVSNGAQRMRPMTRLAGLLARAAAGGVFGTKMRSVIHEDDAAGVAAVVAQQFEVGHQILDAGLVPIIEPEVDITSSTKAEAEARLRDELGTHLDAMPDGRQVMLKLSIPSVDGFYGPLMAHPAVLRVVALSGGYPRTEANERLTRNPGLIASFSRALVEDLHADQSAEAFDAALAATIDGIYRASIT
jgi:fructose-bisphosphate aldolase class I